MVKERSEHEELVIKMLGDYMLRGWVLTESTCEDCMQTPLMRTKDSKNWVCALCDIRDEEKRAVNDSPASIEMPSVESSPLAMPEPTASNTSISDIEHLIKEDEEDVWVPRVETEAQKKTRAAKDVVSGLLGEKMLQGWAMLADECPNPVCSSIPLMRNKAQERFCVGCKHFVKYCVDGESIIEATKVVEAKPVSTRTAVVQQVIETPAVKEAEVENMETYTRYVSKTHPEPQQKKQKTDFLKPVRADLFTPATPALSDSQLSVTSPLQNSSSDVMSLSTTVDAALATLHQKLSEMNGELSGLDATNVVNLKNVVKLCDAISKCAGAIRSLRAVNEM